MWVLRVMVTCRKEISVVLLAFYSKLPIFLVCACWCGGVSLGFRTIDPYSPHVVNRNCSRLQKQGSVFSKRCDSNPKQQVLCAHDKERFCCFGYVSFLLTFHSFILIIVSLLASFLHLCSKTWHEKM